MHWLLTGTTKARRRCGHPQSLVQVAVLRVLSAANCHTMNLIPPYMIATSHQFNPSTAAPEKICYGLPCRDYLASRSTVSRGDPLAAASGEPQQRFPSPSGIFRRGAPRTATKPSCRRRLSWSWGLALAAETPSSFYAQSGPLAFDPTASSPLQASAPPTACSSQNTR